MKIENDILKQYLNYNNCPKDEMDNPDDNNNRGYLSYLDDIFIFENGLKINLSTQITNFRKQ
jgi:hypothetical protein